jgi:cobalt-zinc-cadmium efflux system membrane fusion protein
MTRRLLLLCLVLGCEGEPAPEDEHASADADHHEDEAAHEAMPTRVRLSDAVVRDARITWAPAQPRRIARTVRLPGEVVADPGRRARVAARLPGVVEDARVEPGARVTKGEVIAILRAPDVQALRAEAASLRARAVAARANADRLASLAATRMASEQELAAARAEAEALEAEAKGARDRLRAIGLPRGDGRRAITFEVASPIDGVLVERPVVEGDPVAPETVVGTIVALDEVWFLARVFERDMADVREGAQASVQLNALPEQPLPGTVANVAHQVDAGARTITARIPLSNADGRIRLGLYGIASVAVGAPDGPEVLAVPRSAVTHMLGRTVVFVRHADGDFERHDVTLGDEDTQWCEIVHGLREGEQVVVDGAFAVKSAMLRATFGEDAH